MTQLRARILASFGVAVLVILTGWVGAATLSVSMATRERLQRIAAKIDASASLENAVSKAESAQRAYLLTSDPSYLAPYEHFANDPDPTSTVRALFPEKGRAAELTALQVALVDERAFLTEVVRLTAAGERDAAIALVRTDVGRNQIQRIHGLLEQLTRADLQSREQFRARMDTALRAGRGVVLGGSLVAFALAVLVNVSLMRALREREATQRTVLEQAEQLQRQTSSLLVHEKQLGEQLAAHQQLAVALQQSNEELDRFAYATSHDLKAPLRGIMNVANWVEEDLGDSATADVKRNLGLLRSRARRLEALIEGILRYSRAGRVQDKPQITDVGLLVTETVELIAPPTACIVTIPAPGLPRILTERVPLQQVFMNLIQNGIKHGCPDNRGRIEVTCERKEALWRFSVRDEGPGIASQFHERIFGIFQSLVPRDVVEGTGIGLAVVKRLVESRGGQVTLESSPGSGSCFSFTWPGEVA